MNLKQTWYCREFGQEGWVFVGVDQMLDCGTMIGMRRAVHPFFVCERPALLVQAITEMTEIMERACAQSLPASRACAFSHRQEQQP